MSTYIGLIRKDPDSDFGVDFPDFPGCISAGSTLDEARAMAAEALNAHVAWMREEGDKLPAPSTLEQIMVDSENQSAVAFLVTVSDVKTRAVRVNLTFQEDVLKRIDAAAQSSALSRSAFLTQAALRWIMGSSKQTQEAG